MPLAPGRIRRNAGPWIIVEVPVHDEDPLYPSRRRFYVGGDEASTEHVDKAHRFTDRGDAETKANQIMHTSRNTWAEAMPFSMAWALVHAQGAPWSPREKGALP